MSALGEPRGAEGITGVLRLLRIPFVREFLLTTDALTDATIVTSTIPMQYALPSTISLQCFEQSGMYHGAMDFSSTTQWLSIPAFTVDSITVGGSMERVVSQCTGIYQDTPVNSFPRFAFDNATGELLSVSHDEEKGTTEIQHMILSSAVRSANTAVVLRTDKLRQIVRSNGEIDVRALPKALFMYSELKMERFCPFCRASPNSACGCMPRLNRLKNPMDFGTFCKNFATNCGSFSGVNSRMTLFHEGQGVSSGGMLSVFSVTPVEDAKEVADMSQLAITNRLARLSIQPSKLCMPAIDTPPSTHTSSRDGSNCTSTTQPDICFDNAPQSLGTTVAVGEAVAGVSAPDDFLDQLLQDDNPSNNGIDMQGLDIQRVETNPQAANAELRLQRTVETILPKGNDIANLFASQDTTPGEQIKVAPIDSEVAKQQERERRKELRVQRNRESAARSNLRKKLAHAQLASNLKAERQRLVELQEIESRLRDENNMLRKSVFGDSNDDNANGANFK